MSPTPRQARAAKRRASKTRATTRRKVGQTTKRQAKKAPTPPPAARKRSTKAPPEDLPRTVADLILAGVGKDQIRAYLLAEAHYRPGLAELDELIEQAKTDLASQAEHYSAIATELTIVRLNDLYTRALKVQDLKTALDVQKAIVRFLAVKAPAAAGGKPQPAEPAPEAAGPPAARPRLVGSYSDVMARHRSA